MLLKQTDKPLLNWQLELATQVEKFSLINWWFKIINSEVCASSKEQIYHIKWMNAIQILPAVRMYWPFHVQTQFALSQSIYSSRASIMKTVWCLRCVTACTYCTFHHVAHFLTLKLYSFCGCKFLGKCYILNLKWWCKWCMVLLILKT